MVTAVFGIFMAAAGLLGLAYWAHGKVRTWWIERFEEES